MMDELEDESPTEDLIVFLSHHIRGAARLTALWLVAVSAVFAYWHEYLAVLAVFVTFVGATLLMAALAVRQIDKHSKD